MHQLDRFGRLPLLGFRVAVILVGLLLVLGIGLPWASDSGPDGSSATTVIGMAFRPGADVVWSMRSVDPYEGVILLWGYRLLLAVLIAAVILLTTVSIRGSRRWSGLWNWTVWPAVFLCLGTVANWLVLLDMIADANSHWQLTEIPLTLGAAGAFALALTVTAPVSW